MAKKVLHIVKIGGGLMEEEQRLKDFLADFALIPHPKILVHGGGNKASEMLRKTGLTPKMHNGRRLTDAGSLEVIIMVYAGLINKNIVAELQAKRCNAIGLSGADANLILATKRPVKTIDYGFTGDVVKINAKAISQLLDLSYALVFCALTHNAKGQLLNTNADTIAAELAVGLSKRFATRLIYCLDKKGVYLNPENEDSVLGRLNYKRYKQLVANGVITDGMLPKLENCFNALQNGVDEITLGNRCRLDETNRMGTILSM